MAQLKATGITGSLEVINAYITGSITGSDAKLLTLTASQILVGEKLEIGNPNSTNYAIGKDSLSNVTATYNIGIGEGTLMNDTIGVSNVALGSFSLYRNVVGLQNTAIGHCSLLDLHWSPTSWTGSAYSNPDIPNISYNTAIGAYSLYALRSGSYNIGIGDNAGVDPNNSDNNFLTGSYNILIGHQAGTGQNNLEKTVILRTDRDVMVIDSAGQLSASSFVGDGSGLNNISQGNLSLISSDTSLSTQNTVVVDSSTGDIKITLPSISSNASKEYTIKKGDSTSNIVKVSGYDSNVYIEHSSVTGSEADNKNTTSFGNIYSVTLNKEGTIMAVSATGAYLPGTTTQAGLVFIYKKTNNIWEEIQVISGSQAVNASDYFGEQIAMSEDGNVLLVGAPLDEQTVTSPYYYNGLCYVFHRGKDTNDTFVEHGWLSRDTDASAYGRGVAISKDSSTIAIGAPNTTVGSYSNSGKVYFYKRQPLSASMIEWDQEYTFTGSLAASSDRKGDVLDINRDGTVSIVGSWRGQNGNNDSGLAYIVRSGSSGWYEETVLSASTDFSDYFGNAVSINDTGDLVAIAAKQDEISPGNTTGLVYIFRSGSSGWYQEAVFSGSLSTTSDMFGDQVKLNEDGTKLIVSAIYDEAPGATESAGLCYYLTSGSDGWSERHYFTGSTANDQYDSFGNSVSISEDANTVAVGAPGVDENGFSFTGRVYIFERDVEKIDGKFYYNIEKEDQAVTIKNDSSSEWHVKSSYPGKNTSFNTLGTTKRTIDNIQELVLEGGDYGQLTADYSTYLLSASANSSLTLPSAADNEGMILRFYRIDDHGMTITVTLNPQTGETLRGSTSGTSVQESMQGTYGFYYLMSFGKRGWNTF